MEIIEQKITEGIKSNLSENEVSPVDINGKIELPYALKTIFSENKVNIIQNKDRKKGIEGVRVGLENEVSEMDRKGKNENL